MEGIINALAMSLSSVAVFLVTSGIAFVIFVALWALFGAGLIWSQGSVDAAWQWVRHLPLLVQAVVWLLFLPVVLGLWIWETTWPPQIQTGAASPVPEGLGWTTLQAERRISVERSQERDSRGRVGSLPYGPPGTSLAGDPAR